ncbi:MAG: thiamine pyrophosphate-binding protein [Rhizobiales bacterium]|nr:thiamine pyrophosphate-binding protein [Hyphomicrobiales bacterium]
MNQMSGAEAVVTMLQRYGVRHVFGLCGDTSLPIYDAFYRLDHGITHVLTRDERSAAYMADAYARVTGRVGVCEGPSGGGATYILPGVVEANESSIPVLALTTDIGVSSRGRHVLTELDQKALFRPLTKWNDVVLQAEQIPRTFRRAFRAMTTGRPGAVHLGLPFDVQKQPVDEALLFADPRHQACPAEPVAPDPEAVERLVEALLAAADPVIVCGGGPVIAGAFAELQHLAERLAIPVATSISGKGAIAETHPLCIGVVGSNGGVPETRALIDAADSILFIGCRAGSVTTERWRHPPSRGKRILHIDVDPEVIGTNYETEAALVGDARLALAAVNAVLDREGIAAPERTLDQAKIAAMREAKFAGFQKLATSDETPIRPERVVATLARHLPEEAVVVADPGTPCPYLSAYLQLARAGRQFISNRAHGALGYSLPAVVGAKIGRPEARCVAVMGDGSFGFACGEMETIQRLGLPVTLIVISNAAFGWIKAGQRSGFDQRYFSVDFTAGRHAAIARAFGIEAFEVDQPGALDLAMQQALTADHPTLIDIACQPLHEARAPVSEWIA